MTQLLFFKCAYCIFIINIVLFIILKHEIESGDKYPRLYESVKTTLADAFFEYTQNTNAYILNTYYYPKSKSLGENGMAMVLLINKNTMRDITKYQMTLVASNGTDVVVPKIMNRESDTSCAYTSVVAKTNLLEGMTKLEIKDGETRMEIPFRRPRATVPTPVIICISPQFLSEQWQLFVTHAHVTKRFGGHLHLYITSMVGPYYHLIKEYEKQGYVTVDYWIRPKFLSDPDALEPNANSDWRNQAGANTDCLLQYKEAATFITFVDIDEVLFPKGFESYYDEFSFLSFTNPNIDMFLYDRREYMVAKQEKMAELNFTETFGHSYFVPRVDTGKPMARPSNIISLAIHVSYNTPQQRRMYIRDNFLFHLQKPKERKGNETDTMMNAAFRDMPTLHASHNSSDVLDSLQRDFDRMLAIPEIQLISHHLQKDNFYLPLMMECYYGSNRYQEGKCMNADGCEIPQREDLKCVHSDAEYASGPRMSPITFHYHTGPKFLINVNCTL